jgi:hypothetical protein
VFLKMACFVVVTQQLALKPIEEKTLNNSKIIEINLKNIQKNGLARRHSPFSFRVSGTLVLLPKEQSPPPISLNHLIPLTILFSYRPYFPVPPPVLYRTIPLASPIEPTPA